MSEWVHDFWVYFLRALWESEERCAARSAIYQLKKRLKEQWDHAVPDMENLKRILLGPPVLEPTSPLRKIVQWFYLRDFRRRYQIPRHYPPFYAKEVMGKTVLRYALTRDPSEDTFKVLPLSDPVTGRRLRVPVRYKSCTHIACFEGDVAVLPEVCPLCKQRQTAAFIDTAYVAILAKAHWRTHEAYIYPDITVVFPVKEPTGRQILDLFRFKSQCLSNREVDERLLSNSLLLSAFEAHHALLKAELKQNQETMCYSGFD